MVWPRSACPNLKQWVQQLTKIGKKENNKYSSLLFRGYEHYQLKREVTSFQCSLFKMHVQQLSIQRS